MHNATAEKKGLMELCDCAAGVFVLVLLVGRGTAAHVLQRQTVRNQSQPLQLLRTGLNTT
jgi:hypothetical protein